MPQLVQYLDSDGTRRVGSLSTDATHVLQLRSTDSVYALMHRGLHERRALGQLVEEFATGESMPLVDMPSDARLLPCFDHPVTSSRCFAWANGDAPAALTLQPFTLRASAARITPGDAAPNALVYTVDVHQHLRVVGYAHVSGSDTARLGAVLHVADEATLGAPEGRSVASIDPAAFEARLKALADLRFGDVHIQVVAPDGGDE